MKATVDANVLFACLIKEGETRRLWFHPGIQLFSPAFIITEFLKYKPALKEKHGQKVGEFQELSLIALNRIQLIADGELKPYLNAASTLSRDEKDWLYLACALKENTILWSNDKELRNQTRIVVKTTSELLSDFADK